MPPVQAAPHEFVRILLIIGLLFYLSTSSDNQPPPGYSSLQEYARERLLQVRQSISVLNASQWGDFIPDASESRWVNLTGFRQDDGYAWDRLDAWKERSKIFNEQASGNEKNTGRLDQHRFKQNFYHNISGLVRGRWVRYTADLEKRTEPSRRPLNLSAITPGVDWLIKDGASWTMNVTGKEGKLTMKFEERNVNEVKYPSPDSMDNPSSSENQVARDVAATLNLHDKSSSSQGWDMRLHGVHWPQQGTMLLTTTSEKYAGIFGLPHLAMDVQSFSSSRKLLNMTLSEVATKLEHAIGAVAESPWLLNPDGSGETATPVPHCEFVVFAQVQPLLDLGGLLRADAMGAHKLISQLEEELRFPNGAPSEYVPELQMSTVMFSPDCGFIIESKGPPAWSSVDGNHLVGSKQEVLLHGYTRWLLALAAVIFCQTLLWKYQSKEASTPSTMSRVSIQTLAMLLLADGLLFASLSLLSASESNLFPSALIGSFIALMSIAIGAKFIGTIYGVQEPERQRAQAAERSSNVPQATPSVHTPTIAAAGVDIAPSTSASSTANPASITPVIIPSDQDVDAEIAEDAANTSTPPTEAPTVLRPQPPTDRAHDFSAQYGQFVLLLTIILFLSLSSWTWPPLVQKVYIYSVSFIYLSFWVPQIRRNIVRNCRKALMWEFIIGQSIFRLLPFAYFLLKEDNILFAQTDWIAFCILAGWVWIQVWVLIAQEILSPRYGIPKHWTEEGWDYHPVLREEDVESGNMPLGLLPSISSPTLDRVGTADTVRSSSSRKEKHDGTCSVDCAICMQVLEVPVMAAGEDASSVVAGGVVGILNRRLYMVTPCRHIFHSMCLEGWMKYRLQCPICRENLPPL